MKKLVINRDTLYIKATYKSKPFKIYHTYSGRWIGEQLAETGGYVHYLCSPSLIKMAVDSGEMTDTEVIRDGGTGVKVAEWYAKIFSHDTISEDLPQALTFETVKNNLDNCSVLYDLLGLAADSIVRERITAAATHQEWIEEGDKLPYTAETHGQRQAIAERIDRYNLF